jgi:hypothetical protein
MGMPYSATVLIREIRPKMEAKDEKKKKTSIL